MTLNYTFFILLGAAILLVWTGIGIYKKLGLYIFLTALILGVGLKHISFIGLGVTGSLATILYLLQSNQASGAYKLLLHLLHCLFFIGFSIHFMPGFHNWKIFNEILLSPHAIPYTMYLNVEKPIYIFLFLYFSKRLSIIQYNWSKIFKWTSISLILNFILLSLANYGIKLVEWAPKIPASLIISVWIPRMLLDTALGEEIFFRGYVQKNLTNLFKRFKLAPWIGCILAALIFGVRHLPAGIPISIMATLAGIGYGLAYLKTNTIESSTLTHFLVNLLHFFLFTYPMLASSI